MIAVDVAVVGAGPAGCAAAIQLARAGREVLLVDRARFPRDKCCGDGLTAGALRHLEALGLDPGSLPSWRRVDEVALHDTAGRAVHLELPRDRGTFAAVVRRRELDAALVDLARAAGVEVADGCACTAASTRPGADHLTLDVAGMGRVAARYAVGADGMWSPLRKQLGLAPPAYLGDWHAFRQYFVDVGPQATRQLLVWFEPDLLPGYLWSFPLGDGRANVGFGIQRGAIPTQEMKVLWPRLLDRPHIRKALGTAARPEERHRAWPIPARIGDLALSGAEGRALFVGDAAGAADRLTGEGIGQALLSGSLAADAITLAGPLHPARAARTYERSVERELTADAAMSNLLLRPVARPASLDLTLRLVDASAWTRRNFARWLFEDYPRAYLVTARRWGEHHFTGDGAFTGAERARAAPRAVGVP